MSKEKEIVIIESPFAGDVEANIAYARAAVRDSLLRGEAPYASHLLYTQEGVLNDLVPVERELGITAGFEFRYSATKTAVYWDRGISNGMKYGIKHARSILSPVEYRSLEGRKRCYLAGPMEFTTDNGLGWRLEFQKALAPLKIECFVPGVEEEKLLGISATEFAALKTINPSQYKSVMRKIIRADLDEVLSSNFVITRWEGERVSGTIGEAQHAYLNHIPNYLVTDQSIKNIPGWFLACFTEIFGNLDELVSFLGGNQ